MPIASQDIRQLSVGSTALPWAGNLDKTLDAGETVTGVSIACLKVATVTTEISVSSVAASTGSLIIKRETVTAGRAIQCIVNAATAVAGTMYTLRATITTSATTRVEIIDYYLEAV